MTTPTGTALLAQASASPVSETERICTAIVEKLSALRVPDDGDLSLELREYNTAIADAIAVVWDVRLAEESPAAHVGNTK